MSYLCMYVNVYLKFAFALDTLTIFLKFERKMLASVGKEMCISK